MHNIFKVRAISIETAERLMRTDCQYCRQTIRLAKKLKMKVLIDTNSYDLQGLVPQDEPTGEDYKKAGLNKYWAK